MRAQDDAVKGFEVECLLGGSCEMDSLGVLVLFPTLAVGWLDFQVDVILARLESDFSDQPPSIPVVPNQ